MLSIRCFSNNVEYQLFFKQCWASDVFQTILSIRCWALQCFILSIKALVLPIWQVANPGRMVDLVAYQIPHDSLFCTDMTEILLNCDNVKTIPCIKLHMLNCDNVKTIPWIKLHMGNCDNVKTIPCIKLHMLNCDNVKIIPWIKLHMGNCDNVKTIPCIKLHMGNCDNVKTIPCIKLHMGNCDNVKTIPWIKLHMGNSLFHYILQHSGESSVMQIDTVYVYHVFITNHLNGVLVDLCFMALQHILGHFGHGLLP